MKEIIGIAGGMGAYACCGLFMNLLHATQAKNDQDFPEVIVHNNPLIPDRTEYILRNDDSPIEELTRTVQMLEACGVSKIIIACITAHTYYDVLQDRLTKAKIINIVDETVEYIKKNKAETNTIGIVCSQGSVRSGLWQKAFSSMDVSLNFLNDKDERDFFNGAIYGEHSIKAGYFDEQNTLKLKRAVDKLKMDGAELILGACSELQLVLSNNPEMNYYDVFNISIQNIVDAYYKRTKAYVYQLK